MSKKQKKQSGLQPKITPPQFRHFPLGSTKKLPVGARRRRKVAGPNVALRQIREAIGMSQADFSKLLGCSTAHVQAIELGQRGSSSGFAQCVSDKTGALPICIVEKWNRAVDLQGNPYTEESYRQVTTGTNETVDEVGLKSLLDSASLVVHVAAAAGKAPLALNMLKEELSRFAERAIGIKGFVSALKDQASSVGSISVGQLRSNKVLAEAFSFKDDPTLPDDKTFNLNNTEVETPDQILQKLFPKTGISLNWDQLRSKYGKR